MKKNERLQLLFMSMIFILMMFSSLFPQGGVPLIGDQKIPDDPPAETTARRWWYMDGNRVWLKFFNDGMLANWPDPLSSIWPKGSGINMSDGVAVLVQAKIPVDRDGIPLPPGVPMNPENGDHAFYFCETYYREDMDVDPSGQFNWGYYPVRGYLNLDQDKPAISNDPNSWPIGGWPDAPDFVDTTGVTEWNGYFGRGLTNADLEAYFITNDAWDLEYQQPNVKEQYYFPRPNYYIGDGTFRWGGLGSRVGTRLFQWTHPYAQDVIFVHYDIANISDYDYDKITLSFYIDSGIGGGMDDFSYMDKKLDMTWIFDSDGIGAGGVQVGIMAFAYLESPGFPYDGVDNDDDGIIDEQRGPERGVWTEDPLEGPNGSRIDREKFEAFYYPIKPGPHWTGDENQNWRAWADLDSNGVFTPGIDEINDDTGSDGVRPSDPNYYGPDPDGTEANGMPDDGEPNFGRTDKDESDQIGLTSFQAWHRDAWTGASPDKREFRHDSTYYELTAHGEFNPNFSELGNVLNLFASGPVPIEKWTKERFSVAELHTWDKPYEDWGNWSAPALFQLKKNVQRIYNSNYRFAKPPTKPKLTAQPGDGQVVLTWDAAAEDSKEPFLNYIEDFEGYKIIKSTEPYFEDARVITDGFGSEVFLRPIAQFDLKDGIKGFADWSVHNGVSFYLGDDTGLKHSFVDYNVTNGITYYYAVIAYDFGQQSEGLSPVENTATITLNQADSVTFIDRNCAMVTPRAYAAGYVQSEVDTTDQGWVAKDGGGSVKVVKVDPAQFKENHDYAVTFAIERQDYDPEKAMEKYKLRDDKIYTYRTTNYFVMDRTDPMYADTLLTGVFPQGNARFETPLFDGLRLDIMNVARPVVESKYWENPANPITASVEVLNNETMPWDYTLHIVEDSVYRTPYLGFTMNYPTLKGYKTNIFALNHNYHHKEFNGVDSVMVPDTAAVVLVDVDKNGKFEIKPGDALSDFVVIGEINARLRKAWGDFWDSDGVEFAYKIKFLDGMPEVGSVYHINVSRPFWEEDEFRFTVTPSSDLDVEKAKVDMQKIKVVPNPYVATNLMEPHVRQGLNQRRRLMFTHVPAQCTISIYSASGFLVDRFKVNNPTDDGHAVWTMQTKEGLEIAYGLYIYRVEAPGIGEKVGKFAVIK